MNRKCFAIMLLIVSLAIQSVTSRVPCDETGKYYCPDHFNCCKLTQHEGYSCCYETKACTSDGEHCYMYNLSKLKFEVTPAIDA